MNAGEIAGYTILGCVVGLIAGGLSGWLVWYFFSPKDYSHNAGTIPIGPFVDICIFVCAGSCLGTVVGISIPLCVLLA